MSCPWRFTDVNGTLQFGSSFLFPHLGHQILQHWKKILTIVFILLGDLETLCPQNLTVTVDLIRYSLINDLISFSLGIRASQVMLVVNSSPTNAGDARDVASIPGLGRSPGGEKVTPLQDSCLENPMDRGAWQAPVHGSQESDMTDATYHTRNTQLWNKLDFHSYDSHLAQAPDFFISPECLLVNIFHWN